MREWTRRSLQKERLKVFSKTFRLSRSLRVRLKCYSAPTSIFYDNCLIEKKGIRMFTHALMGKQYWKVNVNFQLVFHSWDEIEIYFFALSHFLSFRFSTSCCFLQHYSSSPPHLPSFMHRWIKKKFFINESRADEVTVKSSMSRTNTFGVRLNYIHHRSCFFYKKVSKLTKNAKFSVIS